MSASSFDEALSRVLVHEGGWANHPQDPGGATMKGVTQRVYDGWRKRNGLAARSVRNISEAELKAIYRKQYWEVIRADEMPDGVDYAVFDGAVNSGPAQAAKWLQRAVGVTADGMIGEATLKAVREHPDHDALIADMLARRLGMLKALRTWKTFAAGWSARLASVKAHGQAAAMGSVGPAPRYVKGMEARARLEDAATPSAPIGGATAGAGGGAVAATLEAARQQLEPYAGASSMVATIFGVLVGAGALVAIGGAAYGLYSSYRSKQVAAALDGDAPASLAALPAA